ncbi:unnamed protein product [Penicillium glandicola]
MQSADHKRRKTGFAYPAIPARDQDIPPYGAANKPTSFRTVDVCQNPPSKSIFTGGCLVTSPLAASQSVYAGGRPIHYDPGDYSIETSYGPLSPRSPAKYNQHFDRHINPRRFLTPADLDSLRELFPEAVGVHLLIAGFLVILFQEERHVLDVCYNVWPLGIAGLQVCFQLAHYSFTAVPVESGNILQETSKKENNAFAGCLGLKLKLQNGSTAVTTVTHGFVRNPNLIPSRFNKGLQVFKMVGNQMKEIMRRPLPFNAREHDRALVMAKTTLTDNNPDDRNYNPYV